MAEFLAAAVQTVAENQNVLFTDTTVCGNNSIIHRASSGLVTLRGVSSTQCRARFRITFGANIAVPTGGTAGAIQLALAINGEAISGTAMIVTPAAVEEFFNVGRTIYVDIPTGCCSQISVKNTSDQDISVEDAILTVERVA